LRTWPLPRRALIRVQAPALIRVLVLALIRVLSPR
jgi:hypothetical protein